MFYRQNNYHSFLLCCCCYNYANFPIVGWIKASFLFLLLLHPPGDWDFALLHICVLESLLSPGEGRPQLHLHLHHRCFLLVLIPSRCNTIIRSHSETLQQNYCLAVPSAQLKNNKTVNTSFYGTVKGIVVNYYLLTCLLLPCSAVQVEQVRSCWCLVRASWRWELLALWPSARCSDRSTLRCRANSARWEAHSNYPAYLIGVTKLFEPESFFISSEVCLSLVKYISSVNPEVYNIPNDPHVPVLYFPFQ